MAHPQFSFLQSFLFEKWQISPCAEISEDTKKKKSLFSVIFKTFNSTFRVQTNLVETRNIVTAEKRDIEGKLRLI